MASRIRARSIREATRFTTTTPYPISRAAVAAPANYGGVAGSTDRYGRSEARPGAIPLPKDRIAGETPEQRVMRLRMAYQKARSSQVSTFDKVVYHARSVADMAHRGTVWFLIVFSGLCFIFMIFVIYDMAKFNKLRRTEFYKAIANFKAESLEAARVAFIAGTATPEQIEMVEKANQDARMSGSKLPSLLSPPTQAREKRLNEAEAQMKEGSGELVAAAMNSTATEEEGSTERQEVSGSGATEAKQGKSWWRW